jgi:hypothetical protein
MNMHCRPDRRHIVKRYGGGHRDADASMTRRPARNRRTAVNGNAPDYIDGVIHQPQRTLAPSRNFTINPEVPCGSNGLPPFAFGNVPSSATRRDRQNSHDPAGFVKDRQHLPAQIHVNARGLRKAQRVDRRVGFCGGQTGCLRPIRGSLIKSWFRFRYPRFCPLSQSFERDKVRKGYCQQTNQTKHLEQQSVSESPMVIREFSPCVEHTIAKCNWQSIVRFYYSSIGHIRHKILICRICEYSFDRLQGQSHISRLVAFNFDFNGGGLESPGRRSDAVFRLLRFQPESEFAAVV